MTTKFSLGKVLFLLLFISLLTTNCDSQDLKDRLDVLEGTTVTTINEQITAINTSISDLKEMDAALDAYIKTLETTVADLQEQINEANAEIAKVESELGEEISVLEQSILNELNTAKEAIAAELTAINATLVELKAADAALDKKIEDLQTYVDSQLASTTNWANTTFSTLTQYAETQAEIATIKANIEQINASLAALETRLNSKIADDIKAAIDALRSELNTDYVSKIENVVTSVTSAYNSAISSAKEELTAAYKAAIATAIAESEAGMKAWVNEQLTQSYYDIATLDGILSALSTRLEETDADLLNQINDQKTALQQAMTELTNAYKAAISSAIEENNGLIDKKVSDSLQDAMNKVDAKLSQINSKIESIENRLQELEDKLDELTKEFSITFEDYDVGVTPGSSASVAYTITGATEKTTVKALGQNGWRAQVIQDGTNKGKIKVTAPDPITEDEIIVLVYDGEYRTIMSSINFVTGVIAPSQTAYEVPAEAGTVDVEITTNYNYSIKIPEAAQTWLTLVNTKSIKTDLLTFSYAANKGNLRQATVVVEDESGNEISQFVIIQVYEEVEIICRIGNGAGDTKSLGIENNNLYLTGDDSVDVNEVEYPVRGDGTNRFVVKVPMAESYTVSYPADAVKLLSDGRYYVHVPDNYLGSSFGTLIGNVNTGSLECDLKVACAVLKLNMSSYEDWDRLEFKANCGSALWGDAVLESDLSVLTINNGKSIVTVTRNSDDRYVYIPILPNIVNGTTVTVYKSDDILIERTSSRDITFTKGTMLSMQI